MSLNSMNIQALSQAIYEFYNTQDEKQRRNLQNLLDQFQEGFIFLF